MPWAVVTFELSRWPERSFGHTAGYAGTEASAGEHAPKAAKTGTG